MKGFSTEQINSMVDVAVEEAKLAAASATQAFLAQHGDRDACGFSWVTVKEKGSTKLGKALIRAGFRKAYNGGLELWNPSGSYTQAITAKEVGADAFVRVFKSHLAVHNVDIYAGSRLD